MKSPHIFDETDSDFQRDQDYNLNPPHEFEAMNKVDSIINVFRSKNQTNIKKKSI